MSKEMRKSIDNFKTFNNKKLNEIYDGTMETQRRAFDIKDRINLTRSNDFHFWKEDDEVLDLFDELKLIGFFYDEDSWDVFPEED